MRHPLTKLMQLGGGVAAVVISTTLIGPYPRLFVFIPLGYTDALNEFFLCPFPIGSHLWVRFFPILFMAQQIANT